MVGLFVDVSNRREFKVTINENMVMVLSGKGSICGVFVDGI